MARTNQQASAGKTLSLKVSNKGAVQLDGLRRFPVTFYADEWAILFEKREAIEAFIKENASMLNTKAEADGGQSI